MSKDTNPKPRDRPVARSVITTTSVMFPGFTLVHMKRVRCGFYRDSIYKVITWEGPKPVCGPLSKGQSLTFAPAKLLFEKPASAKLSRARAKEALLHTKLPRQHRDPLVGITTETGEYTSRCNKGSLCEPFPFSFCCHKFRKHWNKDAILMVPA